MILRILNYVKLYQEKKLVLQPTSFWFIQLPLQRFLHG